MAELLVRRSGSRALGSARLFRAGGRALGGGGLVASGISAGGGAVGGAALLVDEANGFAADFTYAMDAKRVAVKASSVVTEYAVDAFFANAGTSPKMVWDAAGVLTWSPHNMVLQSQTFDHASWAKSGATVSANATAAPDGTTTADAFIPNNAAVNPYSSQAVSAIVGATYTATLYVKNGTLGNNWLCFTVISSTTFRGWFNLATGAKGTSAGSPISYNMTDVGSGWYKVDLTITAAAVTTTTYLIPVSADAATTATIGNGTSPAFYLWGAQINRGSVPTAYLPTTTAARFGLALDYDPVTHAAQGLLCEPAATNLLLRSSEFDNASWLKSAQGTGVAPVVTANAGAAPNGVTEADRAVFTTGAGVTTADRSRLQQSVTLVASTAYVFSLWMKSNDGLSHTISFLPNGVTAAVQQNNVVTTSWQRFTYPFTTGVGETAITIWINLYGNLDTDADILIWGAQLETGAAATSPIPTFAASVTRAVDLYQVTPASINYSATAGSWWAEAYLMAQGGEPRIIGYNGSTTPFMGNGTSTAVSLYDTGYLTKAVVGFLNSVQKVAAAFQSGSRALTAQGLAPQTDAGSVTNLLAAAVVYFGNGNGTNPLLGYIRKAYYVPRRLSNAELTTKTTP